jgi:hypothetical protein
MPNWDDMDGDEQDKGNVVNLPGVSDDERKKRQQTLKQRSGDALKEKWQGEDRKELAVAEAMTAPPVIAESRCATCQSEHRLYIERQLLKGRSYRAIAESVPNGPSRKSISEHYRRHMDLDSAAIRAILETEASAIGQNFEEGVRGAITLRGMLAVLVQKGFEDALNGITTVEPKDIIQMGKLMTDLNEGSGQAAVEEAGLAISIFKEAIQNVLIKGDIVDRSVGMELLQGINDEVMTIRESQEIDKSLDSHLLPAAPTRHDDE